jgi:hypothetical protein
MRLSMSYKRPHLTYNMSPDPIGNIQYTSGGSFDLRAAAMAERRWVLERISFDGLIKILEGYYGHKVRDGISKEDLVESVLTQEYPA